MLASQSQTVTKGTSIPSYFRPEFFHWCSQVLFILDCSFQVTYSKGEYFMAHDLPIKKMAGNRACDHVLLGMKDLEPL